VKKISKRSSTRATCGGVSSGPSSIAQDLTYDRKRIDEIIKRISAAASSRTRSSKVRRAPKAERGALPGPRAFSTMYDFLKTWRRCGTAGRQSSTSATGTTSTRSHLPDELPERSIRPDESVQQFRHLVGPEHFPEHGHRPFEKQVSSSRTRPGAGACRADARGQPCEHVALHHRPRGLVGGPDLDQTVDQTEWQDYIRKSQTACGAGGEHRRHRGGQPERLRQGLKRIDNETSDYYVLGYYSSNPDPTIRTRKLEIKVKRPDMSVYSRQSTRSSGDRRKEVAGTCDSRLVTGDSLLAPVSSGALPTAHYHYPQPLESQPEPELSLPRERRSSRLRDRCR